MGTMMQVQWAVCSTWHGQWQQAACLWPAEVQATALSSQSNGHGGHSHPSSATAFRRGITTINNRGGAVGSTGDRNVEVVSCPGTIVNT